MTVSHWMESRSISRVTAAVMAITLSAVLTACGGGEDEAEPTATSVPVNAQPTVEASVESTPETLTVSTPEPTPPPPPPNTDMSSPRSGSSEESTPEIGAQSTPPPMTGGETATTATPADTAAEASTPASQGGETSATPQPTSTTESTPVSQGTSDGTSGAGQEAQVSGATPEAAATPVAGEETAESATPEPSAEVPVVTSCDVADVPAFTGEVTSYVLSVDLNFRQGPGADCGLIGDGPLGEFSAVEVVGGPVVREGDDSGEWVQIEVGGQVGWVAFQYLEPAE